MQSTSVAPDTPTSASSRNERRHARNTSKFLNDFGSFGLRPLKELLIWYLSGTGETFIPMDRKYGSKYGGDATVERIMIGVGNCWRLK